MWFKVLGIIKFICSLVLEAEIQPRAGGGEEKKAEVMKSLTAGLRKDGLLGGDGDPHSADVLQHAESLVDSTVGLLNATGAFPRAPEPVRVMESPPDDEASAEG